jgi:hypothetical protein
MCHLWSRSERRLLKKQQLDALSENTSINRFRSLLNWRLTILIQWFQQKTNSSRSTYPSPFESNTLKTSLSFSSSKLYILPLSFRKRARLSSRNSSRSKCPSLKKIAGPVSGHFDEISWQCCSVDVTCSCRMPRSTRPWYTSKQNLLNRSFPPWTTGSVVVLQSPNINRGCYGLVRGGAIKNTSLDTVLCTVFDNNARIKSTMGLCLLSYTFKVWACVPT